MIKTSVKTQFVLKEGAIHYDKVKYFYDTSQKPKVLVDSIIVDSGDYPLTEIAPNILKYIRESGQPGFVLKKDGKLFYTTGSQLHRYQNCVDYIKSHRVHKCNEKDMMCRKLSSLPDAKGGCAKVRDKDAVIEDYDFITEGYEFFNIPQNSFIVLECNHWIPGYEANKSSKS